MSEVLMIIAISLSVLSCLAAILYFVFIPLVTRLSGIFRLSSLNQYLYLAIAVFSILKILLILVWPHKPVRSVTGPVLWLAFFTVLIVADKRKFYHVEIIGVIACGLWVLTATIFDKLQSGLSIKSGLSLAYTGLLLIFFGIILSHPFNVLQRANRIKKLKERRIGS